MLLASLFIFISIMSIKYQEYFVNGRAGNSINSEVEVRNVPVIEQMPDLPTGCEATDHRLFGNRNNRQ